MKRKRRGYDDDEDLRNKIRRLEQKLMQRKRRRIRIHDSSDSDSSDEDLPVSSDDKPRASRRAASPQRSPQSASPAPETAHQEPAVAAQPSRDPARPTSPQPGPSSAPDQYVPAEPAPSSLEDMELDEDILNLLGEAPKSDSPLGKGIHKDVASRWQEILNKGLQKDIKDQLTQEYLSPENCSLLVPPILNPEAKAAFPEALIRRDTSLMLRQKQIALALSALAQATNILIKQKSSAPEVLKPISDACRILCDSHFTETKMRRNFVISAINTSLKDTLINAERDKFLFGENVSDKLKAAQSVQKSGDSLKNTRKSYNPFNKANFTIKNRYNKINLNYNTPYRKTTNPSRSDTGRPRAAPAARPAPALPGPGTGRYNTRYRARERERSRTPPRRYNRRR